MTKIYIIIGIIASFVVSCMTFWKLGKREGKKDEQYTQVQKENKKLTERSKLVSDCLSDAHSAVKLYKAKRNK